MEAPCLYIASSPALDYAKEYLRKDGISIADSITEDVSHILLPIPTREIPEGLPEGCTIIGGHIPKGIDLLKDEVYLAQNAAITAHGAVKIAMNALPVCLWDCETLILGWGRIAQCLAHLLKGMGGKVSIAARKQEAVALAGALGFGAFSLESLNFVPYRLVFNTIPSELGFQAMDFPKECVKIDLASIKALPGEDVIWARGLPGKEAPESSGALIARRTAYYLNKE
ncbi:MAG: hypothetical protein ACI3W5_08935 [Faecousia sp.]